MSSDVTIRFPVPVSVGEWNAFCSDVGLEYRPSVIGRNFYYFRDVQVKFGDPSGQDAPPNSAIKVIVGTYWMGNLEGVARIANLVKRRFGGSMTYDPEFALLLGGG